MNQLEAKEKQLEAAYTANQAAIAKASGGEYTETFGLMVGSRSYDKTLDVQRDAAWKALEKAKEEVSAAQSKSEDHKQKMELGETDKAKLEEDQQAFHSAAYLFTALPESFRSTKTNGDGKFQLQLPRSGSWVLAAISSRHISDSVEEYYWLFQVDAHADSPQKVMLSNDNLFPERLRYPVSSWNDLLRQR